jgi:hypothetical protein
MRVILPAAAIGGNYEELQYRKLRLDGVICIYIAYRGSALSRNIKLFILIANYVNGLM